jgi:hypothetical protein
MSVGEEFSGGDKRCEARGPASSYHSVEINLGPSFPIYQFGLRDISNRGMCILVRADSPILKHIKVGDVLAVKLYSMDALRSNVTRHLTAEIRHITEGEPWGFAGSCLVGLRIKEEF